MLRGFESHTLLHTFKEDVMSTEVKTILLTYKDNWADEFNVEGLHLISKETLDEIRDGVNQHGNETYCWWFGSNQGFEDYPTLKEYWENTHKLRISEQEAEFLERYVLNKVLKFGSIPDFIDMIENIKEGY